jgi:hypothetical protein
MIGNWFNLYTGGAIAPPVQSSPEFRSMAIYYNAGSHPYLSAYPGQKVVRVYSFPDLKDGATDATNSANWQANTGLAYDWGKNEYISTLVRGAEKRVSHNAGAATSIGSMADQGLAYSSVREEYHVLLTTGVQVYDSSYTLVKTLTFATAQPAPGMVFYHELNDLFYCSYDGAGYVRIWQPDWVANTLTLQQELTGIGAEEGVTVDYTDNSIWVNAVKKKKKYTHGGQLVAEYAFTGSGQSGNVNEGLAYNHAERVLACNSDEYYHGGIAGGNRLWILDPEGTYNKRLSFPNSINWQAGLFTNTQITGGKLVLANGATAGTWQSPVMDFGNYTMPQQLANYIMQSSGNVSVRFRGSAAAPSVTGKTISELLYYTSWGATVPGGWQAEPAAARFIQIEIILTSHAL